ncbi:MAG: hypothetical protein ACLQQ4_01440 [Bacteroidia bacterium]
MNKYRIIRRVKKLIEKLSSAMQGEVLNEIEVKPKLSELELLVEIIKANDRRYGIPKLTIERLELFTDSFREYLGAEKNSNPDISNMLHLKNYLMQELGIPEPSLRPRRVNLPYMLFI